MSETTYDDMSIEDLEAVLDGKVPPPEEKPTEEPAEPTPEPVHEDPANEGQAEETAESETPETEGETAPEPDPETDPEVLRSRLAEMEATAKKWEQVAGRHGGEIGFLRKKLDELNSRFQSAPDDEGSILDDRPAPVRQVRPSQADTSSYEAWAIQQAAKQALTEFVQANPDYQELQGDLDKYLESVGYDPKELLVSRDPVSVGREVQRILSEHYWHARATREQAKRAELISRKAEQTKQLAKAKQKASTSASASQPPPKPRETPLEEKSLEELDAILQAQTGGRW